jgi:hypothetical protein
VSITILANTLVEKTIWYPTILGILVVVFAVGLFCGSAYLLLGTNLGARLGFLVAFTALAGFMVLLTALWLITASPLNTIKGRIPSWEAVELVTDPTEAETEAVRDIEENGREVSAVEAANVKAAADENLVAVEALPSEGQQAQEAATAQAYAQFDNVTQYMVLATYETGGSKPNPLDFELTHTPLYAVVQFCQVVEPDPIEFPFGVTPPEPECDSDADAAGFLVLERDLGSLRVPPLVAFIASALMFGLGLLALHWRERDEQEAEKAKGSSIEPATT